MHNPWKNLNDNSIDGVFQRSEKDHPLGFFWGRGPGGEYLFLYEAEVGIDEQVKFPSVKGIDVVVRKNKVLFSLRDNANWMMFLQVCNDLIRTSSMLAAHQVDVVLTTLIGRLSKWQEFLGKKRKGLSEAEIKGVIGELLFLRDHLGSNYGIGEAVGYWSGPKGAPQDFSVGDIAYEVKCQEGVTEPYIRISSEFQLCTQLADLFLFVVTVTRSSDDDATGTSLRTLIDSIRLELQVYDPDRVVQFEDLLMEVGVLSSEDGILDDSYHVAAHEMFRVNDEFPRLCEPDLPVGIRGLNYRVSLNEVEGFKVPHNEYFER